MLKLCSDRQLVDKHYDDDDDDTSGVLVVEANAMV